MALSSLADRMVREVYGGAFAFRDHSRALPDWAHTSLLSQDS